MIVEALPNWLIHGLLLGGVAAIVVLVVFIAGTRRYGGDHDAVGHGDPNRLRHIEVRTYLRSIGEVASEHTTIDGITVDFWLPDRSVAITFNADVYFNLREAGVTAVLLEHEIPGYHIGARLPFETPSFEGVVTEEDNQSWAYETLDLAPDATEAAIEDAYRQKIKEAHPDLGGDQERLMAVLEAYEVLIERS